MKDGKQGHQDGVGASTKYHGLVVWTGPKLGMLTRAGFSVGATLCGREQHEGASVGMPICPFPGKGGAGPSLTGWSGQPSDP